MNGFNQSVDSATAALECLAEPMPPEQAARLHRLIGVHRFVHRDRVLAEAAFLAARTVDPEYAFPENMVPQGHGLRTLYESVQPGSSYEDVPKPASGELLFDGDALAGRPVQSPTIVQIRDRRGRVVSTNYLETGAPLPDFRARKNPTQRSKSNAPLIGLAVGAGSAAVISASLLAVSASSNTSFNQYDPSRDLAQLDDLRDRTNTLGAVGVSAGIVALGAGVGALVVATW